MFVLNEVAFFSQTLLMYSLKTVTAVQDHHNRFLWIIYWGLIPWDPSTSVCHCDCKHTASRLTVWTPAGSCLYCLDLLHSPLYEAEVSPSHLHPLILPPGPDPSFTQESDFSTDLSKENHSFDNIRASCLTLIHRRPLTRFFTLNPALCLLVSFSSFQSPSSFIMSFFFAVF